MPEASWTRTARLASVTRLVRLLNLGVDRQRLDVSVTYRGGLHTYRQSRVLERSADPRVDFREFLPLRWFLVSWY